jgi:hypothetical protein
MLVPPTHATKGNPEGIDLGALKTDLEFLIERVERHRNEQALKLLYMITGSAAIGIAWIELFWNRRQQTGSWRRPPRLKFAF